VDKPSSSGEQKKKQLVDNNIIYLVKLLTGGQ